jgi:hypothetical protein
LNFTDLSPAIFSVDSSLALDQPSWHLLLARIACSRLPPPRSLRFAMRLENLLRSTADKAINESALRQQNASPDFATQFQSAPS